MLFFVFISLLHVSPFGKGRDSSFEQIKISYNQGCLNLANRFCIGKRKLKFVNAILLFNYYLPLKMGVTLHLNKLELPFTKQCLILSLDSIGQLVLEKILKCCHFVLPFGKGRDPSFDLNSFHPKMLCAEFGWNFPCGSGEEDEKFTQIKRRTGD